MISLDSGNRVRYCYDPPFNVLVRPAMDNAVITKAIEDLKSAGRALNEGIRRANQLPDNFPADLVTELIAKIDDIDGPDEDSLRMAAHLRDKILQTIEVYKANDSGDESSSEVIRALHNGLFVEVSHVLSVCNAAEVYPKIAEAAKGRSFGWLAPEERQQLIQEAVTAVAEATKAQSYMQNVTQNGIVNVNISNLDVALVRARKLIGGLLLEFKAELVDLSWATELVKLLSASSRIVADAAKKIQDRLSGVVEIVEAFMEKVLVLSQNVYGLIRRAQQATEEAEKQGEAETDKLTESTPDSAVMGVEPGQQYLDKITGVIWTVDSLFLHESVIKSERPNKPSTIYKVWHARLSAPDFYRGDKTLGVSALRDKRSFELIPKDKTRN